MLKSRGNVEEISSLSGLLELKEKLWMATQARRWLEGD